MNLERDPCHSWDKLGLFILAGLVVAVLGGIVFGTYYKLKVPENGDVLIGGIATGLILFLRDLVTSIRASWEEVTRGKTMDTLGKAGPVGDGQPAPQSAIEGAEQTAAAAQDKADKIAGEA